jgi:hypothetical protein
MSEIQKFEPERRKDMNNNFDFSKHCCFCGKDNSHDPVGYAGERMCRSCGKGGNGEPDEARMAYKEETP